MYNEDRISFYSILVRLKELLSVAVNPLRKTFLFHTGSIKSSYAKQIGREKRIRFYSILVRLKA